MCVLIIGGRVHCVYGHEVVDELVESIVAVAVGCGLAVCVADWRGLVSGGLLLQVGHRGGRGVACRWSSLAARRSRGGCKPRTGLRGRYTTHASE